MLELCEVFTEGMFSVVEENEVDGSSFVLSQNSLSLRMRGSRNVF